MPALEDNIHISGAVSYKKRDVEESFPSNCVAERNIGINRTKIEWYLGSQRPAVNLKWKNISLIIKKGKSILKELSGEATAGQMLAIMGPSGAGKTTFLDILSGFSLKGVTGQILVNGSEREMHLFKKLSCYIMQDDKVHPHLTVKEAINMAASLKIFSSISKEERKQAVLECMEYFRLNTQENTRGRSLSGGERKRLCIAQEIVSNPSIIFLDEPTSGLDTSSCLQVMELLKCLANEGRTIICTIHQSSAKIFEMFDKVYMIAEGNCIYRGTAKGMVSFFSQQGFFCPTYHNPADFAMEIAAKQYGDCLHKLKELANCSGSDHEKDCTFANEEGRSPQPCKKEKIEMPSEPYDEYRDVSASGSSTSIDASNLCLVEKRGRRRSSVFEKNFLSVSDQIHYSHAASSWQQFRIIALRSFISLMREPLATHLRFLCYLAGGIVMGTLFYGVGNDGKYVHTNAAFIFTNLILVSYMVMMPTLLAFPIERDIVNREYLNNWYSLKIFYFARTVAEIPLQLILPLLYCGIVYWLTDQPKDVARFMHFLLTIVLLTLIAQAMGFIIGGFFSLHNAVFLGPFFIMPPTIFCGYLISVRATPIYYRWLSYISYVRCSMENIMACIYSWNRTQLICTKEPCIFRNPQDFLKHIDMDDVDIYVNYAIQISIFLVLWFLGYLIVLYRTKHKM